MKQDKTPELLAPAGAMPALQAALKAGADAVYLGLKALNARNGARNFTPDGLAEAVKAAHAVGAKVHLTLNTDLEQRELGMAARSLALACQCGVDAVLVRDPALLLMRRFFPGIQFHFSTQAAISSSAGVCAARRLGLSRVVLARELSLPEIQAAASVPGIETEVFVQGALCFCCSGRCLLSSWGGGRSGNRGRCASPCRVMWTAQDGTRDRALSMLDLCLAEHIPELISAGVDSLKIEGRLKSPDWVARAVSLYRHAIDNQATREQLRNEAATLGDYTGRSLTDAYLQGVTTGLTADAARTTWDSSITPPKTAEPENDTLNITVNTDERGGTLWTFSLGEASETHRTPPQRVANARRAVSVTSILDDMRAQLASAKRTAGVLSAPAALAERLLPRTAANNARDALNAFLRALLREPDAVPRGLELPAELRAMLAATPSPSPLNTRQLGDKPDRARLDWDDVASRQAADGMQLILECNPTSDDDAKRQADAVEALEPFIPVAALPCIIYEAQLEPLRLFIHRMRDAGITIEVNSWDTWQLASEAGAVFEAGPGLPVMNAMAAAQLASLGCRAVTASCEMDRGQLEDLCATSSTPLSITIFSHPQLMSSRAILPTPFANATFTDARNITLKPYRQDALTILTPTTPMDWRTLSNLKIKAQHLVVDFRYNNNNNDDNSPKCPTGHSLFNYNRRLR